MRLVIIQGAVFFINAVFDLIVRNESAFAVEEILGGGKKVVGL